MARIIAIIKSKNNNNNKHSSNNSSSSKNDHQNHIYIIFISFPESLQFSGVQGCRLPSVLDQSASNRIQAEAVSIKAGNYKA